MIAVVGPGYQYLRYGSGKGGDRIAFKPGRRKCERLWTSGNRIQKTNPDCAAGCIARMLQYDEYCAKCCGDVVVVLCVLSDSRGARAIWEICVSVHVTVTAHPGPWKLRVALVSPTSVSIPTKPYIHSQPPHAFPTKDLSCLQPNQKPAIYFRWSASCRGLTALAWRTRHPSAVRGSRRKSKPHVLSGHIPMGHSSTTVGPSLGQTYASTHQQTPSYLLYIGQAPSTTPPTKERPSARPEAKPPRRSREKPKRGRGDIMKNKPHSTPPSPSPRC